MSLVKLVAAVPLLLLIFAACFATAVEPELRSLTTRGGGESSEVVLVATVDGAVHAVSAGTGKLRWTLNTGMRLVSSSAHSSVERLVPALDGALFLFGDRGQLQRVGMDVQELVARAPSVTADHAWTGSKTAKMFVVDLATGQVVRELASDFVLDADRKSFGQGTILIGRADYYVKGSDRTGFQELWNMSYGKFIADAEIPVGKDDYPLRLSSDVMSQVIAHDKESGEKMWSIKFAAHPVAFYRVIDLSQGTDQPPVLSLIEMVSDDVAGLLPRRGGVHLGVMDGGQVFLIPEGSLVAAPSLPLLSASTSETALIAVGDPQPSSPPTSSLPALGAPPQTKNNPLLLAPPSLPTSPAPSVLDSRFGLMAYGVGFFIVGGLSVAIVFFIVRVWLFPQSSSSSARVPSPSLKKKKKKKEPKEEPSSSSSSSSSSLVPARKLVLSENILGYGSCGTVVLEGTLDGRPVAIKRLLKDFYSLAEKETNILLKGDQHPHVVSYFMREEDDKFVYLALSRCLMNLSEMFEASDDSSSSGGRNNNNNNDDLAVKKVRGPDWQQAKEKALSDLGALLFGIVSGVAHLHKLGICHRDLKPHNVLIDANGKPQISDMGLAKKLDPAQQSFSTASSGTVGYQPPEVLQGQRQSMSVDIWGLGCLIFFVLTKGMHPFGDRHERESNVVHGRTVYLHLVQDDAVAFDLVSSCIESDPSKRPSVVDIAVHPFFWDSHKRLHFLLDVSDLLEALEGDVEATRDFERSLHRRVLGREGQWQEIVSPALIDNLGRYRRYTNSVKDLLRVVRNKSHHYRDLTPALQRELGSHPEGFLNYFCKLFPYLFIECYNFVKTRRYRGESVFKRYFESQIK